MFKVKSPILRELFDEATQKGERKATEAAVVRVLVARLGASDKAVKAELKKVRDDKLEELVTLAATCPDLDTFRNELATRTRKRGG